jgi:hypothetical protein
MIVHGEELPDCGEVTSGQNAIQSTIGFNDKTFVDMVRTRPIYNRFVRWSRLGEFNKIFAATIKVREQHQSG